MLHVNAVLQRLLYAKAEKFNFMLTAFFSGYTIAPGRVRIDLLKVSAMLHWPVPNTHKQLQWF